MTKVLGIAPVLRLIESVYLKWALREISPLHPDLPRIVRRLNELEQA